MRTICGIKLVPGYYCSYRLRVESMLLKEEFSTQVEYIRPSVDVIILAAKGKLYLTTFVIK